MTSPKDFIRKLKNFSFGDEGVFNPYKDFCALHDSDNAPQQRCKNLLSFLQASLSSSSNEIWIARDLGYRGGRRTGIPLTDEIHLPHLEKIYGTSIDKATKTLPMAERTATTIWKLLVKINKPIFLWNIFPFHPHKPNEPLSNRCHTRAERNGSYEFLKILVENIIQPTRIVAIGGDAKQALEKYEYNFVSVRHPSYGGQSKFIDSICKLHGLMPNIR